MIKEVTVGQRVYISKEISEESKKAYGEKFWDAEFDECGIPKKRVYLITQVFDIKGEKRIHLDNNYEVNFSITDLEEFEDTNMTKLDIELTQEETDYLIIEMNVLLRSYCRRYNGQTYSNPHMASAFNKVFKSLTGKNHEQFNSVHNLEQ